MKDIWFLKYEVLPAAKSKNAGRYGPALALCWVRSSERREAEKIAVQDVTQNEWDIVSLEEVREIPGNTVSDNIGIEYLQRNNNKTIYVTYIAGPTKKK
jgi:hypothetical protein